MSLLDAWRLWLDGSLPSDFRIFGVPLLWLGRWGEILQFVGGVTIIVEILGAQRLRNYGKALNQGKWWLVLGQVLTDAWHLVAYRNSVGPPRVSTIFAFPLGIFIAYIAFRNNIPRIDVSWNFPWTVLANILKIAFTINLSFFVATFCVAIIATLVALLGAIVNIFFIMPMAWLLERPSLERIIKLVSLLLLIVGFHFALLSS